MSWASPDARRRTALAVALAGLAACGGGGDPELATTHAYMDSLRVYLGELRAMDYEMGQLVQGDTLASEAIVPLIAQRFRPTVTGLRERASHLGLTQRVAPAQRLLLTYLDVRLEAYDAAILGQAQGRQDLFDLFARKQVEADSLGRTLADEVYRLRTQVKGYR